jgi:hypothetical protein
MRTVSKFPAGRPLDELQFGGVTGSVVVERIVTRHRSR